MTGHLVFLMLSILLKCSLKKNAKKLPASYTAAYLTVVYALTRISALVLYSDASKQAGPLPIERPKTTISSL